MAQRLLNDVFDALDKRTVVAPGTGTLDMEFRGAGRTVGCPVHAVLGTRHSASGSEPAGQAVPAKRRPCAVGSNSTMATALL